MNTLEWNERVEEWKDRWDGVLALRQPYPQAIAHGRKRIVNMDEKPPEEIRGGKVAVACLDETDDEAMRQMPSKMTAEYLFSLAFNAKGSGEKMKHESWQEWYVPRDDFCHPGRVVAEATLAGVVSPRGGGEEWTDDYVVTRDWKPDKMGGVAPNHGEPRVTSVWEIAESIGNSSNGFPWYRRGCYAWVLADVSRVAPDAGDREPKTDGRLF